MCDITAWLRSRSLISCATPQIIIVFVANCATLSHVSCKLRHYKSTAHTRFMEWPWRRAFQRWSPWPDLAVYMLYPQQFPNQYSISRRDVLVTAYGLGVRLTSLRVLQVYFLRGPDCCSLWEQLSFFGAKIAVPYGNSWDSPMMFLMGMAEIFRCDPSNPVN